MNNMISLVVSYKLLRIKSNPGIIKVKGFLNVSAKITSATKVIIITIRKLKILIFFLLTFFFLLLNISFSASFINFSVISGTFLFSVFIVLSSNFLKSFFAVFSKNHLCLY